ncbi:unnamed protein product [Cladocopium goreaui]|uniref:Uncharacterized protein n=1 Tax=Cladocopium goreaui TaxID=2562237 RepID=A0A9P1DB41_9DINO|nr:unnamed protein product [Cladocopium goreaui]
MGSTRLAKVTELLLGDIQQLVQELAGSPVGPQIMLYYGPDLLRPGGMGLGEDLSDLSGQNMMHALEALAHLYRKARKTLALARSTSGEIIGWVREGGDYQYQLNVAPLVTIIKKAGSDWKGGRQLRERLEKMGRKATARGGGQGL